MRKAGERGRASGRETPPRRVFASPFPRIYRVEVIERTHDGGERKFWTRWYLIDDRKPEDKTEIEEQLKFYRLNKVTLQFQAVEGSLPE